MKRIGDDELIDTADSASAQSPKIPRVILFRGSVHRVGVASNDDAHI